MAIKHNNQIPSNHFRKHWQERVKTWFDQPGKKVSRRIARSKKVAAAGSRPVSLFRPIIRCPTLKYNTKLREGRGFTLQELKSAGIGRNYARTVGLSVDHRRKNRSEEGLVLNAQRLKTYMSRVKLIPKGSDIKLPVQKSVQPTSDIKEKGTYQTAELTEDMKNFKAYSFLRKAAGLNRHSGIRAKRAAAKAEEAAAKVTK